MRPGWGISHSISQSLLRVRVGRAGSDPGEKLEKQGKNVGEGSEGQVGRKEVEEEVTVIGRREKPSRGER